MIADEIQASGIAFIMTSKIKGNVAFALTAQCFPDIELVFNKLKELGETLDLKEQSNFFSTQ